MCPLPTWPETDRPRVVTLAGNNLTIDVRARKTASSLARSGYAVIALGIDEAGIAPASEYRDGALIWRVYPSSDPRISPRIMRISRAELRNSFRYRSDLYRARLAISRRYLAARIQAAADENRSTRHRFALERARIAYLKFAFWATLSIHRILARPATLILGSGKWERDLPEMHRYEQVLGPTVDALQPDLIHVHDIFHLGLAVRAASRAREQAREVRVVYDAHEYIAGLPIDARRRDAYLDLEREFIGRADAVVTVSAGLARLLLDDYGIHASIVSNAPDMSTAENATPVREVARIPSGHRVAVYVGGIAPHRGAEMMIHAMTDLPPDVHLVFVAATGSQYIEGLGELAKELDVAERVHMVPYVTPEAVVAYIETADVSVIPLSRDIANYEIALPNKLFQSVQARVPVVVSDNPEMKEYVERTGVGEVFVGGDEGDLVRAISTVLEDPGPYIRALDDPIVRRDATWAEQLKTLLDVYGRLGIRPSRTS